MTSRVLVATVFAVAAALAVVITKPDADAVEAGSRQANVPFSGPGELLTIWEWGDRRTHARRERALILTTGGVSRAVPGTVDARRARWRLPAELLVEEPSDLGRRIVRLNPSGKILEVLSDGDGLSDAEPSSDGRWVALERFDGKAGVGIEVRDLHRGFAVDNLRSRDSDPRFGHVTHAIWNPNADHLALAIRTRRARGLFPQLFILSREGGDLRDLPDGAGGEEPGGIVPLFWTAEGIYARSSRGLLRCDPRGSGCSLVYAPGEARFAFTGTLVGDKKALLLVQDLKVYPFEVRAKEIHEVDLATGVGRLLLRLPDDAFISDIDWVEDAAEGKPAQTAP